MTPHDNASKRRQKPDIDEITTALLAPTEGIRNIPTHTSSMPSLKELKKMMALLRGVFFPGFFSPSSADRHAIRHRLAQNVEEIHAILAEQIHLGICFNCEGGAETYAWCQDAAGDMADDFLKHLPEIRDLLDTDVLAAYEGDPAAKSKEETIFSYPSLHIMTNHRVAHQLYKQDVPVIPRIISEMGHSKTGIDIHHGAAIGRGFFIDHGTGVVIGETCIIGNHCRLYQGVTLGALSFPKDEQGNPIKGLPRHPVLENNVTVYAGATILGRVTIGRNSMIGGNVWLTHDVPPDSKIVQTQFTTPRQGETLVGK